MSADAELTIDLDAIADNYRLLAARAASAACGAVVKADAYGLGLAPVARRLHRAGCRAFFVALAAEGAALRSAIDPAEIYVLNGCGPGEGAALRQSRLIPVLNSLAQLAFWRDSGGGAAALHVDTGMNRLGLTADEIAALAAAPELLAGIELRIVISHLACAELPDHPMNADQLARFDRARRKLPTAPASLANSSGIFLGPGYHLDLVRPGAALYGVAPRAGAPNPMKQVIHLQGKILQLRDVDSPMTVGYGATHRVRRRSRLATVAAGYADGYFRSLSNRGKGFIGDQPVPLVGRVSMDLITFDVTDAPSELVRPGAMIELVGPHYSIADLARDAEAIAYEVLTALGRRYSRRYLGDAG